MRSSTFSSRNGIRLALLAYTLGIVLSTTALAETQSLNRLSPVKLSQANTKPEAETAQTTPSAPVAPNPGTNSKQVHPKQDPGTIIGIVSGPDDKPIIGASVAAQKTGHAHKRFETKTDGSGMFRFENLEPGEWQVSVVAPEMLSFKEAVHVKSNEEAKLTVALEETEASDVVHVVGKRTQINPGDTREDTHIDKNLIQKYGSGNNLRKLINTAPGVQPDSLGNIVTRGEHNAVNYELDGVILPEVAGVLAQSQPVSPRSLQSLDVEVGGYEARDGGGPLGAIAHMRSLPIANKPTFRIGTQLGGPIAGGVNYYGSSPLSQDPQSVWNRVRVESSGNFFGTKLGLEAPAYRFRRNGRFDMNTLSRLEFQATPHDRFTVSAGINETYLHQPTNVTSRRFGYKITEHDRQNFLIASYKHTFRKWLDEANLHVVNSFYSQRIASTNVFDPTPIINGEEQALRSVAFQARRFNYVCSVQGDVSKTAFKTHHIVAGFLSEVRPVRTRLNQTVYNADPRVTFTAQQDANTARQQAVTDAQNTFTAAQNSALAEQAAAREAATSAAIEEGLTEEEAATAGAEAAAAVTLPEQPNLTAIGDAAAATVPQIPYGAIISPFTGLPGGPQFQGLGNYRGFRYLQSGYLQDTWRPQAKWLSRLTFNGGVRADVYHGVFGNSLALAQTVAKIADVGPFSLEPFVRHRVTNAQVSGRYAATVALTERTLVRGSYSDIFTPPPVDIFVQPFDVTDGTILGIFNGAPRPLQATRGRLIDTGIEQIITPRFSMKNTLFYKKLRNFGDSGVIANSPVYNRLTLPKQEAYGLETRIDFKPTKDGSGCYGFVSNTIAVAKLQGNKLTSGGQWDLSSEFESTKYVDHDKRETLQAALGWKGRNGFWALADLSYFTGYKNGRDVTIFGPHPARTKPIYLIGLNMGYDIPDTMRKDRAFMPTSVEVRIENLTNNVSPINLGSPYQGTRYTLPIRVLSGLYWKV